MERLRTSRDMFADRKGRRKLLQEKTGDLEETYAISLEKLLKNIILVF